MAFAVFLAVGAIAFVRGVRFYGSFFRNIVDARTYYLTAHSLVFDRDLQIANDLVASPEHPPTVVQRPPTANPSRRRGAVAAPAEKYPLGLSLVELPFIELARALRWLTSLIGLRSTAPPGFAWSEMMFVGLSLVTVFAASLALIYAMASAEFGALAAILGTAAAWLGTSLFYYSSVFPFMAHAMSFAALALVMWATRSLQAPGPINRWLIVFAVAIGAEFLIRPQQVLVAVCSLPLLIACVRHRPAREWRLGAIVLVLLPAGALLVQVWQFWMRSGQLALTTYGAFGEGFSFAHPRFGIVLWHARAGLIRFSPVVMVAAAGCLLKPRTIPAWVWPSVANALLQIYLVASWWAPTQGETFGSRMWADNAAVVVFGVAALAHDRRLAVRGTAAVASLAATSWTIVLLSQYIGWPK